jgi:hypothetical protein
MVSAQEYFKRRNWIVGRALGVAGNQEEEKFIGAEFAPMVQRYSLLRSE